jgi:folylpolyglutamate synthase/dihydropteroate synthase
VLLDRISTVAHFTLAVFVQLKPANQFRSPAEMAAVWPHCPTASAETIEDALEIAKQSAGSSRVLITGSLYLVGAVLRCLNFYID